MKKVSLSLLFGLVFAVGASASMSYECWAYQGGSPYKMVHVSANNSSEAVDLAWGKFKDLGVKADSVKCK